jgi:hypothetical protein
MTQSIIFEGDRLGMMLQDLTNGLVPIWVTDDEPNANEPVEAPRSPQDALKRDLGIPVPLFSEEDLGLISMVQLVVTFVDGSMEARAIPIKTLQNLLN